MTEIYENKNEKLWELYDFRTLQPGEEMEAAMIEQTCFPPNEACKVDLMIQRGTNAPECFVVAIEKATGTMAGFLTASATDEKQFRDEFFTDYTLHRPAGRNSFILSLAVLPEYQRRGLAREIMFEFLRREKARGREMVRLTTHKAKVEMYRSFGYESDGMSESEWGGNATWVEMKQIL